MAQLGPTVGIVKPSGGMNTRKKLLLPRRKPSRPGRLVKALGHHMMQPNAMPDIQCTMLIKNGCKHWVHKKVFKNIDLKSSEVYPLANQFRRENADVGDKPVKNDAGEVSMSKDAKQKAWLEHYQRLLNVEFDWDPDHLSYQPPVKARPSQSPLMVNKAISQMKAGKSTGPIRHSDGDDRSSR